VASKDTCVIAELCFIGLVVDVFLCYFFVLISGSRFTRWCICKCYGLL